MTEYESCRRWLEDIRDVKTCKIFLGSGKSVETILIEEIDRLNLLLKRKNCHDNNHKNSGPSTGYKYTAIIRNDCIAKSNHSD